MSTDAISKTVLPARVDAMRFRAADVAHALDALLVGPHSERFDVMASVPASQFPGGTMLRWPGLG